LKCDRFWRQTQLEPDAKRDVKILHTSDWHLGVSMQDATCEPEQKRFLNWLVDTINDRQIDVLVVAGDVFHFSQPSNAARKLYYEFLVRCERDTDLRQIVVTGGNHDSPTGLEAASEVLQYLRCAVVGGIQADESTWSDCLVPVEGGDGDVEVVVAAVPYVPEAKLGVSGVGKDPDAIRDEFHQAFQRLYTTLADQAREAYPNATLVATGHLTSYARAGQKESGDFRSQIHQTGTIGFMPPTIFDERFDYVALGHIHRMLPVDKPRVWYSGTPVPTSKDELSTRFVLEYDTETDDVAPLKVPRWRDVHALTGTCQEVIEMLDELDVSGELPPYLFVFVRDEKHEYDSPPFQQIQAVIDEMEEPRPRIVKYRETTLGGWDGEEQDAPPSLDELTPEQVFKRMWQSKHGDGPPDDVLRLFRTLVPNRQDDEADSSEGIQLELLVGGTDA
jgi:exonuclease SbcD